MDEIILYAAFMASALAASLRPAHMLQLASYQWPGYLRWLKNDDKTVQKYSPAACLAMLGLLDFFWVPY
ncbi:MAG: hypothetical protein LBR72_08050, partial [Oscillospiraceae bacterium]|nr:hypothetical protein [Oscillospiraceae bacterium]